MESNNGGNNEVSTGQEDAIYRRTNEQGLVGTSADQSKSDRKLLSTSECKDWNREMESSLDGNNENIRAHDQTTEAQSKPLLQESLPDNQITVLSLSDIPKVSLSSDKKDHKYYVSEDVTITATFRSSLVVCGVAWQRKTVNGNRAINPTLPKYTGTRNETDNPLLIIRDCDESDSGTYTIELDCLNNKICSNQSGCKNIKFFSETIVLKVVKGSPEVNLQEVQPVAPNTRVDLKATIRGFPRYHIVIWKKDENNIDTSDPKYESSEDSNKNYAVLCIKNVKKEDEGKYTIEVQNQLGKGQSSQELKIEGDLPNVTLNQIPLANINECLELKAIIHSSPAYRKLIWTKDGEKIDIDEPKYEGSKTNAGYAVLCIKDVEEEDEALYTIEVHNELGMGQSSQKLKIIAEMIFISGPAVVSPSETIFFQAYLSNRNPSNAKWWKIKDQLKTEITFDNRKFYFYQGSNGQHHKIEIHNAEKEDSATYEFTLDCMKSNKLCVQVDGSGKYSNSELGNCLRLFALQGVSAAAMRIVFDNLPGTFVEKLNHHSKLISEWKDKEISEPGRQLDSSKDLDISLMYSVIKKVYHQKPKKGWGNRPGEHDIGIADDIERIRQCRNRICHTDASGMETNLFNESVLDLLGAIRRLSNGDRKLLETSCEFFNRAFTKEEEIEMIGKLEDFKQKQEKWNQSLQREECRDKSYEMINFHNVCDSSILIWDNNSSASQRLLHAGGVCFMNRPLNLGEEVHIRGSPHHLSFENQISIGLTNQDPKTILGTENKKEASKCELKVFNYCTCSERKHTYKKNCSKEFHIYISLCENATLLMCFNGTKEECHSYTDVSSLRPLWLVIEPDRTETIWISNI